jgi:hypothetical protein
MQQLIIVTEYFQNNIKLVLSKHFALSIQFTLAFPELIADTIDVAHCSEA